MAGMDFVAVPSDSTHVTFEDLYLDCSPQEVVCRLLRFLDSRNIKRDNEFMRITMLFLDEKNYFTLGKRIRTPVSSLILNTISQEESAEIVKEKGNQAFKEKQWEEAIGLYSEAIKLNDSNGTYYSNRAAAYLELGRYRVELQVKDNSGTATFVVFDTEMTKVLSKAAATLTVEARDEEDVDLPPLSLSTKAQ